MANSVGNAETGREPRQLRRSASRQWVSPALLNPHLIPAKKPSRFLFGVKSKKELMPTQTRPDNHDVLPHQPLGMLGVPSLDRGKDLTMFLERLLCTRGL
jgi:hypothetical protein